MTADVGLVLFRPVPESVVRAGRSASSDLRDEEIDRGDDLLEVSGCCKVQRIG